MTTTQTRLESTLAVGLTIAGLTIGGLAPASALAQPFPSKPVTIVVGFPPAGPLDWMARVAAPKLQERWGQPVIVENRPGAGGLLAVQAVQKAAADGHILTPHTQQVALIPLFVKQADIEPGRNLQPLGTVFYTPYMVTINSQVPAKNLREFIAHAKANRGKLNMGLATNTGQFLDSIAFAAAAGIEIAQIGYGGGAQIITAVLANESQLAILTGGITGHIQAGRMVPLAVTSNSRFSVFPDVPTVREAGGFDFVSTVDFGYYTTQGTPRAAIDRLSRDLAEVMSAEDVKEQIRKQGYDPGIQSADQWLAKTVAEVRRAREIAKAAGISPQ